MMARIYRPAPNAMQSGKANSKEWLDGLTYIRKLKADQIKIADKLLTATVTCSGPKGIYEARGELRFGYDAPAGGTGVGAESAKWKFEIKN